MKNIETGKVYTIKLNSGEELIAKVISAPDAEGWVTIESPVSIAPGPQGMGLVPSIFTSDPKADVRLNTSSVSLYSETEDAVKNKYIEAVTGLKLPDKKIIMG